MRDYTMATFEQKTLAEVAEMLSAAGKPDDVHCYIVAPLLVTDTQQLLPAMFVDVIVIWQNGSITTHADWRDQTIHLAIPQGERFDGKILAFAPEV